MGKKIFVSYKFKDENVYPINHFGITTVRTYVDKLENYFDSTDNIYKGESNDEDLSNFADETIWSKLKDRIYDSSLTIVMISPNMKESNRYDKSQWIPWEVSYSLKEMNRNDRVSRSNAMLAIVIPDKNNLYDYFLKENSCFNCNCITYLTNTLFNILAKNMFNQEEKTKFNCSTSSNSIIYTGEHSYIKVVKWSDFINNPNYYIDKAIEIKNNIADYIIQKDV